MFSKTKETKETKETKNEFMGVSTNHQINLIKTIKTNHKNIHFSNQNSICLFKKEESSNMLNYEYLNEFKIEVNKNSNNTINNTINNTFNNNNNKTNNTNTNNNNTQPLALPESALPITNQKLTTLLIDTLLNGLNLPNYTNNEETTFSNLQIIQKLTNLSKTLQHITKSLNYQTNSLTIQSIYHSINDLLIEYYKLVNSFKNKNIKHLLVYTNSPNYCLTFISDLIDLIKSTDSNILTRLFEFTLLGDPLIAKISMGLLVKASTPLFNMIKKWIYTGTVDDMYNEFFIEINEHVDQECWDKRATIDWSKVPCFLDDNLVIMIQTVGKSLFFIRNVCKQVSYKIPIKSSEFNDAFTFGNMSLLKKVVQTAYNSTNEYLINIMYKDYKLLDHFKAIKKYLLLEQGDFVTYLLINME